VNDIARHPDKELPVPTIALSAPTKSLSLPSNLVHPSDDIVRCEALLSRRSPIQDLRPLKKHLHLHLPVCLSAFLSSLTASYQPILPPPRILSLLRYFFPCLLLTKSICWTAESPPPTILLRSLGHLTYADPTTDLQL